MPYKVLLIKYMIVVLQSKKLMNCPKDKQHTYYIVADLSIYNKYKNYR